VIHIVNGDVLGEKVKNIQGKVIVWREMYDWGPLFDGHSQDLINARAQYFANTIGVPFKLFIENSKSQEEELDKLTTKDKVTLWFEHDRYDQTMLIYILNRLKNKSLQSLEMVSINSHDSIPTFKSLGQLEVKELEALFENERTKITTKQLEDAEKAWKLYIKDDPLPLLEWIKAKEVSLPFLTEAMVNHFTFYPNPNDDLNHIERITLKILERESLQFKQLYNEISDLKIDDGLTDLHFAAIIANLKPLITINGELPRFNQHTNPLCSISEKGKLVVTGKAKRTDFSSIDWWLGGVHLTNAGWFYDGEILTKKTNLV
jgi:hypothetical protein